MFIPVPAYNKMLVAPEVFKKVSHRLFDWKRKVEYKGKPWIVLRLDDVVHAIFARHQVPTPAPIEHYYSWPGRYKPFKHQIETAKFFTAYERCFCFNAMGCVHPDTKIVTEKGLMRIADITAPIRVLSWNDLDQKFQLSLSGGAFPKGKETLYRVTTQRGEFVATGHHHIACASGEYLPVSKLSQGMRICSRNLSTTTEGLDQLLSSLDAPSYSKKDVDSAVRYVNAARLCGQQLLRDLDSGLESSPLLDDALRYGTSVARIFASPFCSERGGGLQELLLERIRPDQWSDHLAKQGCEDHFEELEGIEVAPGVVTSHLRTALEQRIQGYWIAPEPTLEPVSHRQPNFLEVPHDAFDSAYPLVSNSDAYNLRSITSDLDTIVSIEPVGEHVYYDMHVIGTENYVCESGVVHHNTGKTLSSLWAADYLMSRGVHRKVLIISPVSTLERVWGDALFESFHHRTYRVIYGSKQKRLKLLQEDADFYVINHDGLKIPEILEQLRKMSITLVIADEFRTYHNQKTQRYKALQTLAGYDTGKSLWAMTGAPMPNGPEDIWAQARLVNPNLVPKYFNRFRHEVMVQLTQFKWVPKKGWQDKCYSMVKPSIRYATEDCLDLPDISYVAHEVVMSPEQAKVYDEVFKACVAEAKEGKIVAVNEAVKLMKLLQIATGAVYTSEKNAVADLAPTPKLNALEELVYETNRKCIVFTPFVHSLEMLERFLRKKGFKVATIHGGTGIAKRNKAFSDFQLGDLEIILTHPQCMAHGVTLTAACHIIWFAPVDNFEIYEQANARVRRAGQTRAQTIIHLQCSKVEQYVYNRLKSKEKTQGALLELLNAK